METAMDRRKFFSFLAVAPLAAGMVKEAVAAAQAEAAPQFPAGYIMDHYEVVPDYGYSTIHDPGHSHGITLTTADLPSHQHAISGWYPARSVVRRKIYDGKQFVDFDSADGAAVINSVLIAKVRG
jgi:hypothetical protein